MTAFDRGLQVLTDLAKREVDYASNEATTRRNILDTFIKDVLGWPDDEVQCEEHLQGDYFDYTLGSPQRRIILEAKRTGMIFDLPAGSQTGRMSLAAVRNHSASNKSAVDQVLRYCQESGTAVAVLSNGHQLLIFLGSRSDGQQPSTGQAYYYASPPDMLTHYGDIFDFLSPAGIQRGDLVRALSKKTAGLPPPPPLSSRIHSYPGSELVAKWRQTFESLVICFYKTLSERKPSPTNS